MKVDEFNILSTRREILPNQIVTLETRFLNTPAHFVIPLSFGNEG